MQGMSQSINAVLARARNEFSQQVIDTEMPADAELEYSNGRILPFYVFMFGGPIRAAHGKGIVSTRNDVTILYCTVLCVAPDSNARNAIVDQVVDTFTGWRPPECGEMILEGGFAYTNGNTNVRPTKYYKEITFTYRANLRIES